MTPCPDLDRLVSDTSPGAFECLDAHAETCAACAAEAHLADEPSDLVDVLERLRGTQAPVSVVEAALVAARHPERSAQRLAADRAPARPSRRRVWQTVAAATALLVVVLIGLTRLRGEAPDAPRVADNVPPTDATPPSVSERPKPTRIPEPETALEAPASPDVAPERASAPRPSAPRARAPRPAPSPRAAPPTVAPEPVTLPDPAPLIAEAPTVADTAAARADLMLAFNIIARAQRTASAAVTTTVTDEMRRVTEALAPARIL